jgi:hypothetical protein
VLELRQAQAVNKETKLKAFFKPSIKGECHTTLTCRSGTDLIPRRAAASASGLIAQWHAQLIVLTEWSDMWYANTGFLGRELSLSRTMIRNLFGAMLSDIMVGALLILVLASGYRAPILIRCAYVKPNVHLYQREGPSECVGLCHNLPASA